MTSQKKQEGCCEKCASRRTFSEIRVDFWAKTRLNKGCMEWQGTRTRRGYGVLSFAGRQWKAHRVALAIVGNDVPHSLVCDHLCKNTCCVNPQHLELVSNGENVLRGDSFSPKNKAKSECVNGHPYSEHGGFSVRKNGKIWRFCRLCKAETDRLCKIKRQKNR